MSKLIERIEAFNQKRDKALRNIKYQMMRETPFAFMRATCHIFYEDWPQKSALNDAPAIWIVGDLHPQNFAVYQVDSAQTYFDINDFDDGLLAPCVWDVARCLTSLHLAFTKPSKPRRKQIAQSYLTAYVAALRAGNPRNIQIATAPPALEKWMHKRSLRTSETLFNKYCNKKRTALKILTKDHETNPLSESKRQHALTLFNDWLALRPEADQLRLVDAVGRIGGLSSIGLERYLLLVEDSNTPPKVRLLEIKQRISSALKPYATLRQPDWSNEATRVVTLQERLQAIPSNPLQVITDAHKSYTVRELEPIQQKLPTDSFEKMADLRQIAETLGKLTAWAHLRGCGRQGAASADDLIVLAGQDAWQTQALKYAADYTKKIASDFKIFRKSKLGQTDQF
jgi:uncharacterized protein (DUF2252 family)